MPGARQNGSTISGSVTESITLPDGRQLGFARFGRPSGVPVLFMHGFPSCRLEAGLLDAAARDVGVSLVAPDRPGFGSSDLQLDRSILDWPQDVVALADALDWQRFWLWGGSAGCPYALACAHEFRHRVAGVAIVAGLGPVADKRVVRKMSVVARFAFALANTAPRTFRAIYIPIAIAVSRYPGLNLLLNRATPPDQEVLAQKQVRKVLDAAVREAFRQGTSGAVQELPLLAGPWGFRVEEVSVPVQVWHGRADGVVPAGMGEALARKAPNARLHLLDGAGHVSLPVRHGAAILRELIART